MDPLGPRPRRRDTRADRPPWLDRDRREVVVHAAAWTDVDGCARDPELAHGATGRPPACSPKRSRRVASTSSRSPPNEVFDGHRTDGLGYAPDDPTGPLNPYGSSKLAGEELCPRGVRASRRPGPGALPAAGRDPGAPQLAIVRTAWLFGPGQPDFPAKILVAAERAREAGEPLKAVADETGCPTYAADLAEAVVELLWAGRFAALHHIVDGGRASRAEWAREVLRLARVEIEIEDVPASTWTRASTPPRWAVLESTPTPSGEPLRSWQAALAERMALRR